MSQTPNAEFEIQQFLSWEAASRDTIDFKKIYVDMTGDLIAGLVLSQIIYWHLPDAEGNTKLRVKKTVNFGWSKPNTSGGTNAELGKRPAMEQKTPLRARESDHKMAIKCGIGKHSDGLLWYMLTEFNNQ